MKRILALRSIPALTADTHSLRDRGLVRALSGFPGRPKFPEKSRRVAGGGGVDRTAENTASNPAAIACGIGIEVTP